MKENTTVPVSSFSLFKPSKDAFMRNFKTFAILLAPSALYELFNMAMVASDRNEFDLPSDLNTTSLIVTLVVVAAAVVMAVIIGALTTKLQLESAKGKTLSLNQLWKSTKSRILPFVSLALTVGLFVLGGLILFIIPGLFLIKRYSFAPYIFLEDESLTVSEAMKKSAAMTAKPYSGYVWGVLGVSVLIGLVFSWLPFIGSLITFVLSSLYSVAMPLRYLELKELRKN